MRKLALELSEQNFNLLWRALHCLEEKLARIADESDPEGEKAAFAGNDLVYLRLYKDEIEKEARAAYRNESVFNISDEVIEP